MSVTNAHIRASKLPLVRLIHSKDGAICISNRHSFAHSKPTRFGWQMSINLHDSIEIFDLYSMAGVFLAIFIALPALGTERRTQFWRIHGCQKSNIARAHNIHITQTNDANCHISFDLLSLSPRSTHTHVTRARFFVYTSPGIVYIIWHLIILHIMHNTHWYWVTIWPFYRMSESVFYTHRLCFSAFHTNNLHSHVLYIVVLCYAYVYLSLFWCI